MAKKNSIKGKKILTNEFYKKFKGEVEWYSKNKDFGDLFARLGKKGEIIKGKKGKEGDTQLYFINIDKIRRLSIHEMKFIIDLILQVANQELFEDDIEGVNFCSLEFQKTEATNRGVAMLQKQKERGKVSKVTKPRHKMKIKIKKRDLIVVKESQ